MQMSVRREDATARWRKRVAAIVTAFVVAAALALGAMSLQSGEPNAGGTTETVTTMDRPAGAGG